MASAWPVSLPQSPLFDGNSKTKLSNRIDFTPDVGSPISRQVTTQVQYTIPWDFYFTAAQKSTFETFYETTLAGGSGSFTAICPFEGVSSEFLFEGEYVMTKRANDLFKMSATVRRIG